VLRAHPNKAELARRLGVDRKTLWRYTQGHRPIPPDLLPRILNPDAPEPGRPRTSPTRRRTTQAAQTRRRRSPGGGPGGPPAGRADPPGTPEDRDRSGGPAGRTRSEHQKERESTDPK